MKLDVATITSPDDRDALERIVGERENARQHRDAPNAVERKR